MNLSRIQCLIEFHGGELDLFQPARTGRGWLNKRKRMDQAFKWLIQEGYIEVINGVEHTTQKGLDALKKAEI